MTVLVIEKKNSRTVIKAQFCINAEKPKSSRAVLYAKKTKLSSIDDVIHHYQVSAFVTAAYGDNLW